MLSSASRALERSASGPSASGVGGVAGEEESVALSDQMRSQAWSCRRGRWMATMGCVLIELVRRHTCVYGQSNVSINV